MRIDPQILDDLDCFIPDEAQMAEQPQWWVCIKMLTVTGGYCMQLTLVMFIFAACIRGELSEATTMAWISAVLWFWFVVATWLDQRYVQPADRNRLAQRRAKWQRLSEMGRQQLALIRCST